jgi:hypothetical protein
MSLTVEQAKKFFGALYDRSHAPDLGNFEAAALRIVANVGDNEAIATKEVAAGDKALALLMLNHVMSAPRLDTGKKAALTAAALLNIKAELVGRFVELFPNMTVKELKKAAEEAGYQVDILPAKEAASVPRSVVGR